MLWKPKRSPEDYPIIFHDTLDGPGVRLLAEYPPRSQGEPDFIKRMQNKYHAFAASLRHHPYHPAAQRLRHLRTRLSVSTVNGRVLLWCTTTESELTTLQKTVDSLRQTT